MFTFISSACPFGRVVDGRRQRSWSFLSPEFVSPQHSNAKTGRLSGTRSILIASTMDSFSSSNSAPNKVEVTAGGATPRTDFRYDPQGGPEPGTPEYIHNMRQISGELKKKANLHELWNIMRYEAQILVNSEPALASFVYAAVLTQKSLADSVSFMIASKLYGPHMPSSLIFELCRDSLEESAAAQTEFATQRDLVSVLERDPACTRFIDPLLFFKGFHALQAYRVSHTLWHQGRQLLANQIHAQASKRLHVDIHPEAQIGPGAFIDHATGVVIGRTAVLHSDVSMLHRVTLGGAGSSVGRRHPTIGEQVFLGAGSTLLGNIKVGDRSQVGACSLVVDDVPPDATAVGVPARIRLVPKPVQTE
mmetsp:Transcript_18657/g.32398  ORF Transcript_18657/g.32398 Transcript_18657/m.32398 type:complete len:363 (-) Transcript_18657:592-1680(-)